MLMISSIILRILGWLIVGWSNGCPLGMWTGNLKSKSELPLLIPTVGLLILGQSIECSLSMGYFNL